MSWLRPPSPTRTRTARRNESASSTFWLSDAEALRHQADNLQRLRQSQRFGVRSDQAGSHIVGSRLDVQTSPHISRRAQAAPAANASHHSQSTHQTNARDVLFNWADSRANAASHAPAAAMTPRRRLGAPAACGHATLSDFANGRAYSNGEAFCAPEHPARRRAASPTVSSRPTSAAAGPATPSSSTSSRAAVRSSTPTLNYSRAQRLNQLSSGPLCAMMRAYAAVNHGHLDSLLLAIEQDGTRGLDDVDSRGYTALHLATQRNLPEMVEAIIDAGGNANARDKFNLTPLHVAAQFDAVECARVLVEFGRADVRSRTTDGRRPIDIARECGSHDMCVYLTDVDRSRAVADDPDGDASGATGGGDGGQVTRTRSLRRGQSAFQLRPSEGFARRSPRPSPRPQGDDESHANTSSPTLRVPPQLPDAQPFASAPPEHIAIIQRLLEQNEQLVAENKRLKDQLKKCEKSREADAELLHAEIDRLSSALARTQQQQQQPQP